MKPLLLIFTLFFSTLMFSAPASADWTKVAENTNGVTLYVDFERMRKHEGYVYFWRLTDYLKPDNFGDLSAKVYRQVDCKLFRFKYLSYSFHTDPMGGGTPSSTETPKTPEWRYPPPGSSSEHTLKTVCSR